MNKERKQPVNNKPITLSLIVNVTYEPNGESEDTLRELLYEVAKRAASEGLLSGGTNAEVVSWNSEVPLEAVRFSWE
jgi:hypothetical protein